MKNTLKFAAAALATIDGASAALQPGKCPVRDQNKDVARFDAVSMAGLWFEYVWDEGSSRGYDYKCSTWIVLSDEADEGPGHYAIFNNMIFHPKADDAEGQQDFIRFRMKWDDKTEAGQKARATFMRKNDDAEVGSTDKEVPQTQI